MFSALCLLAVFQTQMKGFPVGEVELFGHTGLNEAAIRKELPIQEGKDLLLDDMLAVQSKLEQALIKTTGKKPTDMAIVGVNVKGKYMVFVGVAGPTVKTIAYRTGLTAGVILPAEATDLYKAFEARLLPAISSGGGAEDHSKGYALFSDPELTATQLKMRDFAVKNEPILRQVLDSAKDPVQRKAASMILGYVDHSQAQIECLVRAVSDPEGVVRNNAVRSLGVILKSDETAPKYIAAGVFVDLVRSGTWTDRNKGTMVLEELTKAREPKLMAQIRKEARPSLVEMAKWRNMPHARSALVILGRAAGIEEERLQQGLNKGDREMVLKAVGK